MSVGNVSGGQDPQRIRSQAAEGELTLGQAAKELSQLVNLGSRRGRLVLRGEGNAAQFERHRHFHRQMFISAAERDHTNQRIEQLLQSVGRGDLVDQFRTHVTNRATENKSVLTTEVADLARNAIAGHNASTKERLLPERLRNSLRGALTNRIPEDQLDALCRREGLGTQELERRVAKQIEGERTLLTDAEITDIIDRETTRFVQKKVKLLDTIETLPEDSRAQLRAFAFSDEFPGSPQVFRCAFGLSHLMSGMMQSLADPRSTPGELATALISLQQQSEAAASREINLGQLEGADEIVEFPSLLSRLAFHMSDQDPAIYFQGLRRPESQELLRDMFGSGSFLSMDGLTSRTRKLSSGIMTTVYGMGLLAKEHGVLTDDALARIADTNVENFESLPRVFREAAVAGGIDLERVADAQRFNDLSLQITRFAQTLRTLSQHQLSDTEAMNGIWRDLGYDPDERPEEIAALREEGLRECRPNGLLGGDKGMVFYNSERLMTTVNDASKDLRAGQAEALSGICNRMQEFIETDRRILALGLAADDFGFLADGGRFNSIFRSIPNQYDQHLGRLQKRVVEELRDANYHIDDLRLIRPGFQIDDAG